MTRNKTSKYYLYEIRTQYNVKCISDSNCENTIYQEADDLQKEADAEAEDVKYSVFSREELRRHDFCSYQIGNNRVSFLASNLPMMEQHAYPVYADEDE